MLSEDSRAAGAGARGEASQHSCPKCIWQQLEAAPGQASAKSPVQKGSLRGGRSGTAPSAARWSMRCTRCLLPSAHPYPCLSQLCRSLIWGCVGAGQDSAQSGSSPHTQFATSLAEGHHTGHYRQLHHATSQPDCAPQKTLAPLMCLLPCPVMGLHQAVTSRPQQGGLHAERGPPGCPGSGTASRHICRRSRSAARESRAGYAVSLGIRASNGTCCHQSAGTPECCGSGSCSFWPAGIKVLKRLSGVGLVCALSGLLASKC